MDLKAIYGLDGSLRFLTYNIETETLAQVCLLIYENLGRHNIPKANKYLQKVLMSEVLGEQLLNRLASPGPSFWLPSAPMLCYVNSFWLYRVGSAVAAYYWVPEQVWVRLL